MAIHRLVEREAAVLDQHRDAGRGHGLGHRRKLKYRIDGDALPPGYVGQPIASCEADLSVPGPAHVQARDSRRAHRVLTNATEPRASPHARAPPPRTGSAPRSSTKR